MKRRRLRRPRRLIDKSASAISPSLIRHPYTLYGKQTVVTSDFVWAFG